MKVSVVFLDETPSPDLACAHRDNVTQPWINDSKCKLVTINNHVTCNCTILGEITVVVIPEEVQSSDSIISKEGDNVRITYFIKH